MALTSSEALQLDEAIVKHWTEETLRAIREDSALLQNCDAITEFYIRAYWGKFVESVIDTQKNMTRTEDRNERIALIYEMYGDQLNIPSGQFKVDVAARLDWLKRRTAKEFEQDIKRAIDLHGVTSPIEQIFLMEWKFAKADANLGVKLVPQVTMHTERGEHVVDFLITSPNKKIDGMQVVIELDGHQFHERTSVQATRDRARDRAMLKNGVTVLRFAGAEVVRDARRCIREVMEFLEAQLN